MRSLVTGVTLSLTAHAGLMLALIPRASAPLERAAIVEIVAPEPPPASSPSLRTPARANVRETPRRPATKPSAPRAILAETPPPTSPAPVVREAQAELGVAADSEVKRDAVREAAERTVAKTPVAPEAPPNPPQRQANVEAFVVEPTAGGPDDRTSPSTESSNRVPTSPVNEGAAARVATGERRQASWPGARSGAGAVAPATGGTGDPGATVARGTPGGGAAGGGATPGSGAPGGGASGGEAGRGAYSGPRYGDVRKPAYPWAARVRGEEGVVVLSVRVDSRGQVTDVRVVESSGSSVLDDSAVSAVQQWRFDPAKRGREPVESVVQVPVRFSLRER